MSYSFNKLYSCPHHSTETTISAVNTILQFSFHQFDLLITFDPVS